MNLVVSRSAWDTFELGRKWGMTAAPGLVIGLSGDLGAGKTELVKGIAVGLGVQERVHSPTFILMNLYESGRLPLYHLDLYRLDRREEIEAAGLEEYFFQPEAVVVVEWIDRWNDWRQSPNKAQPYRAVRLEQTAEEERQIRYEDIVA